MGEFAKRAAEVLEPWELELERQQKKLYKKIPSSKEEATTSAINRINELRQKSYMAGYLMRHLRSEEEETKRLLPEDSVGVPGREISLALPEKKAGALDALTRPLRETAEDLKMHASQRIDEEKERLTRTTSDPGTLPWYYPMMALTAPNAFAEGFRKAEKDIDAEELARINERLVKAKAEFEKALEEEYSQSGSLKVSSARAQSAGEMIDGLAQMHVKCAEGELNQILGTYLALAALLGQGAHMTAKEWAEKRDPKRQKLKLVREAVRQRMRSYMPPIRVEAGEPGLAIS